MTITISAVSFLFLIRNLSTLRLISFLSLFFICLIILSVAGLTFFSDLFNHISSLFSSAFNVFFGGNVTDASSQSRIQEFEIAKEGFLAQPFFGNGFLSSQWKGGFSGIYGHFYPSDIGWMGLLYLYGSIGVLIYFIPFVYAFYMSMKKGIVKSPMVLALHYVFLYYLIFSLVAGLFVKKIGIIFFIFSLIYYNFYKNNKA